MIRPNLSRISLKFHPNYPEKLKSLAVEVAPQRLFAISGHCVSGPPSPPSVDRAKAPGTAGFRGTHSLAVGSYEGEWWWAQSQANPSPLIPCSAGKIQGIFEIQGSADDLEACNTAEPSALGLKFPKSLNREKFKRIREEKFSPRELSLLPAH